MNVSGAVFFDIDGVILDSLPPHLKICRDVAQQYNLDITIPTEKQFRDKLATGEKISPMFYFFKAVGFPDNIADKAVMTYEKEFMRKYEPKAFFGFREVFQEIRNCGWRLGLVTSNVIGNVMPALGESIKEFEANCIFTHDNAPGKTKAWCLAEGARRLMIRPAHCFYVGDLPSDAMAASNAGFRFIGATYGWGFKEGSHPFETAKSIREIPKKIGC